MVSGNVANILFQNLVADRKDRTAIITTDAVWTYERICRLTCQVGNGLRDLGVDRENRVALLMVDSPELVASFYGAAAIGAVPVPLNTSLLASDLHLLLNHSRAKTLIVSEALFHLAENVRQYCPHLREVVTVGERRADALAWNEWINGLEPELVPIEVSPDEPAFWLYSSGSTGRQKGVVHLHRAVSVTCSQYAEEILRLTETDLCFSAAKLFHAYGLGNGMNFPFFAGGSTLLWHGQPLPEMLFDLIRRFRPSVFFATPALFVAMLGVADARPDCDLSSLRCCVSAGEALPATTLIKWRDRFGVEIVDGIGSTEMLHIFISNRPGHVIPGCSGRVVPGYSAKIVDEDGNALPTGEIGDLWVKGESSFSGYWLDRARSRATLIGEWVVTGDKYYQDADGCFWHQGRSDDMLKANGVWVSPLELEALLRQHPAVAESAVIGVRDEHDLLQIKAVVVLRPDADPPSSRELQAFMKQRAPQRYPRWFEFVDALPKTATGKVKRFELRDLESEIRQ
ncbi:MAG TPA: benzoate-CoA ligase family protein [Chthoniobacterales bacterium]